MPQADREAVLQGGLLQALRALRAEPRAGAEVAPQREAPWAVP